MKEISKLFNMLKLGEPIEEPRIMTGGQLHHCFWVQTPERSWVLKKLNHCVIEKLGFPSNYEQSEQIAQDFKRQGLNAVCAEEFDHHYVQQCGDNYFLLYPFIQGRVLKARSVTLAHATKAGQIFAQLHKNRLSEGAMPWEICSREDWQVLLRSSRSIIDDDLAGQIVQWNEQYQRAIPYLNQELVISHRDLHYGNVIWDHNEQAHLIDWESAGVINPNMELIGYALEWSGVLLGILRAEIFKEIISSYERTSQTKCHAFKEALDGWLGHCLLPWLYFNLQRLQKTENSVEMERGRAVLHGGLLKSLYFLQRQKKDILSTIWA